MEQHQFGFPHGSALDGDREFLCGSGDGGVQPTPVVLVRVVAPPFRVEDNLGESGALRLVNRQRHSEVELQPEAVDEGRILDALALEVIGRFDCMVAAELVAIQKALDNQAVVWEEDYGFIPVIAKRLDAADDAAHAVEDWRRVLEADDEIPFDRFLRLARHRVEVLAYDVAPHEDRHVESEALVGLADDLEHVILRYELDGIRRGVVLGDVAVFADCSREMDDGVVGGLSMDVFEANVWGSDDRLVEDWGKLSVVPDCEDWDVVVEQVFEQRVAHHGGFVDDDAFDGNAVLGFVFDEEWFGLPLPTDDASVVICEGFVDEAMDGADAGCVVHAGGNELSLDDIRGFARERTEGRVRGIREFPRDDGDER